MPQHLRFLGLLFLLAVIANVAFASTFADLPNVLEARQSTNADDCTIDAACYVTDYGCQCGFADGSFMEDGSSSAPPYPANVRSHLSNAIEHITDPCY